MISIIITAFKEPKTIGRAINSFISQNISEEYEIIISAPDKETIDAVKKYKKINNRIKIFKDPGKGKSYALNLLLPKIKGKFIILSDGDVYVSDKSVKGLLNELKQKNVGCVTGRPVPIEDKKTKYGYWANFLFDSAHRLRKELKENNRFLECSGYLWAFRTGVVKKFPLDVAEDAIVPYLFMEKGYSIGYSDKSFVFVKNVDNLKEWVSQKIRTIRAHETLNKYVDTINIPRTKTFLNEIKGISFLITYPTSIKELFWSVELILARLYVWMRVFFEVYLLKKYHKDLWERVESTK